MKSRVMRIFLVAFMVMACGGFWGFSQAEAKDVWVYTVPDSEFGAGYEVYVDDESISGAIQIHVKSALAIGVSADGKSHLSTFLQQGGRCTETERRTVVIVDGERHGERYSWQHHAEGWREYRRCIQHYS